MASFEHPTLDKKKMKQKEINLRRTVKKNKKRKQEITFKKILILLFLVKKNITKLLEIFKHKLIITGCFSKKKKLRCGKNPRIPKIGKHQINY